VELRNSEDKESDSESEEEEKSEKDEDIADEYAMHNISFTSS